MTGCESPQEVAQKSQVLFLSVKPDGIVGMLDSVSSVLKGTGRWKWVSMQVETRLACDGTLAKWDGTETREIGTECDVKCNAVTHVSAT